MIYTWTKNIILTGLTGWTRSCCKRTEKNPEDPVDPPEADKSCLNNNARVRLYVENSLALAKDHFFYNLKTSCALI